jgi:hypothetical protein
MAGIQYQKFLNWSVPFGTTGSLPVPRLVVALGERTKKFRQKVSSFFIGFNERKLSAGVY